jgi:hypothetical protein
MGRRGLSSIVDEINALVAFHTAFFGEKVRPGISGWFSFKPLLTRHF